VILFSLPAVFGSTMFYGILKTFIRGVYLIDAYDIQRAHRAMSTIPPFSSPASLCGACMNRTTEHHTRRAAVVAATSIMMKLGGILVTWLLGSLSPAPNYTSVTITFITMSIDMVGFSSSNLAYPSWQNRLKGKKRKRRKMTKENGPEGLGNRSAWYAA